MKKTIILFFISQFLIIGQQTPGNGQFESMLIENALIHIGDGSIIKRVTLDLTMEKLITLEKQNLKIIMTNQSILMELTCIQD